MAIPNGMLYVPMAFSIMLLACVGVNPSDFCRAVVFSGGRLVHSVMELIRSLSVFL